MVVQNPGLTRQLLVVLLQLSQVAHAVRLDDDQVRDLHGAMPCGAVWCSGVIVNLRAVFMQGAWAGLQYLMNQQRVVGPRMAGMRLRMV